MNAFGYLVTPSSLVKMPALAFSLASKVTFWMEKMKSFTTHYHDNGEGVQVPAYLEVFDAFEESVHLVDASFLVVVALLQATDHRVHHGHAFVG